jgi:hypothetical protein
MHNASRNIGTFTWRDVMERGEMRGGMRGGAWEDGGGKGGGGNHRHVHRLSNFFRGHFVDLEEVRIHLLV